MQFAESDKKSKVVKQNTLEPSALGEQLKLVKKKTMGLDKHRESPLTGNILDLAQEKKKGVK
jgi:hypothetical protein